MGFWEWANRKYGSSPIFPYSNPSITAGDIWVIDFSGKAQNYVPFPMVFICNNSDEDIEVWINQAFKTILPSGNEKQYQQISSLKIVNAGTATITAGLITISAVRE